MGEGSTEKKFLDAAASALLCYVSGLIKWCLSSLSKLALTELGQNRKGVTLVAFNGAVIFLSI